MLEDNPKIRPTRIVIVDRNEVTRKGLQGIIRDADESYEVLATFAHLDEIDPFIENQPIDVVVIDDAVFDPPQIVRLIARYHDTQPRIGITILSLRSDGDYVRRVMRYGSAGFVMKSSNLSEQLLIAVKLVAEKYPFISSDAAKLLDSQVDRSLRHRDQDVLRLLESELSVKEIAVQLELNDKTVYRVRNKLKQVLGVRNNENIIDAARKKGLLDR
jgi:DNA-binding NarL/FixJ family response regulator